MESLLPSSAGWLSYFVNPALVIPGLLLMASPIIIHLINRMRFRRVQFAAMEFLLKSQRKNRRRVLLEQLLLLLLRVAIVFCIMLLLARLVLSPDQLSLLTGNRAHHVVIIDDSGSMQDQWADTTAFSEALDVVRKLVAEGARHPDTQELTLMYLSNPDEPLIRQQRVNEELLTQIEADFENRQCTHQTLSLTRGLEMAGEIFSDQVGKIRHLHVVSDFRRPDWEEQQSIGESLQELDDEGVSINLVKTTSEAHPNLSITDLSGSLQVAAAGVPLRLRVAVTNHGSEVARNVRLAVMVDGQRVPLSVAFDKIDPGEEVYQEKDLAFEAGRHEVRMELQGDSLTGDNKRYLAIDVADANPVLIIDGDPSGEEGMYLADALAADPTLTGFDPLIENVDFLTRQPLDRYQCIYLLNVPDVPANAIEPLENYVDGGGGLAWFLGPSVNTVSYNKLLYADGDGLFPLPLAATSRELEKTTGFSSIPDIQFEDHPIFLVFSGDDNSWVDQVKIERYVPAAEEWELDDSLREDNVRTIASLRDGQPFIVEKTMGASGGRIIACMSTVGPNWNNWPRLPPCYVPTHLELEKYIAREDHNLNLRTVGEPIELALDPVRFAERVDIASPDGDPLVMQATTLQADPDEQDEGPDSAEVERDLRLHLDYADTDLPGVYQIRMYDQDQQPVDRWVAYNVPASESQLDLMSTSDLRKRIGEDVRVEIHEPGELDWLEGKDVGQEIRDFLLYALIALLIAEQLLAYRLSYHPSSVGAVA